MSVNELEEGEILDDSLENSDDEGEVKEVSHVDMFSIEKSIMQNTNNNNQSNDPLYMSTITDKMPIMEDFSIFINPLCLLKMYRFCTNSHDRNTFLK